MEKIFLAVLNMSLTASFVIAVIMLARLLLKKAPKIISYALWAVAGFRLAFPFTLESVFSLLPFKATPIPQDIAMQAIPRIDSGITVIDNAVSASLPAATPAASVNPLQTWIFVASCIWLLGIAVMLVYSFVSIILLRRRLRDATLIKDNIYESNNLKTPFVIGLFSPKIYIPAELSADERQYIILHEQTHIRRYDHVVKMLSYLVLCLHWFNPFAWIAFVLMGADMEMSCDERVMRELGGNIKNAYSLSLVRVAAGHKILNGSPLAFGEGGMKERIKNVLKFKKVSRIIVIVAVALVAVLSVGFAVNRSIASTMKDWAVFDFPSTSYGEDIRFYAHAPAYSPDFQTISATLVNDGIDSDIVCGESFRLMKSDGKSWYVVPFSNEVGFNDIVTNLEKGREKAYTIKPNMFDVALGEGTYRIVTDVYYPDKNTHPVVVWAWFTIDKNGAGENNTSPSASMNAGVVMSLKESSITPSNATIILSNSSVNEYSYGDAFKIERKLDGVWRDMDQTENAKFLAIAHILSIGQSVEVDIKWDDIYGNLVAGEYRIVKEIQFTRQPGDYDTYTLSCEFLLGIPDLSPLASNLPASLSPDGKIRLEFVADTSSNNTINLNIVDTETGDTLITHRYPSDTQFTVRWRDDSQYAAVGYQNSKESRVVVYVTKQGSSTFGQGIYSYEHALDYSQLDDANWIMQPVEFKGDSTLVYYIEWSEGGTRHKSTITWDFVHGDMTSETIY